MNSEYYSDDFLGTYYVSRYYFSIRTGKLKTDVGLITDQSELAIDQQRELQYENLPVIIHEYIHYLHELSTVVGSFGLGLDITLRSLFSQWMDLDPHKAESKGTSSPEFKAKFANVHITKGIIDGSKQDTIDGKFVKVNRIEYKSETIYVPYDEGFVTDIVKTPVVYFDYSVGKVIKEGHLHFGKFFIYEGIAYELDRIVDQKLHRLPKIDDKNRGTEYIVLRRVARFIYPDVDTKTYLSVGVMALQHLDCGRAFIQMLEIVREQSEKGIDQTITVQNLKNQTSEILASKSEGFMEAQDEYHEVFLGRRELYRAVGYLTASMKHLYKSRIENPCFEVDLIFEGNINALLTTAQVCDYLYIFDDSDEYMRDFFGTTINHEDSHALKVLLVHHHFFGSHQMLSTQRLEARQSHKCPFFTCCSLPYRTLHESTCANKPWRIYEISASTDLKYCLYGQGVMESKGLTERPANGLSVE